jgi:hypothetical protein
VRQRLRSQGTRLFLLCARKDRLGGCDVRELVRRAGVGVVVATAKRDVRTCGLAGGEGGGSLTCCMYCCCETCCCMCCCVM